jgi:acetyl esterase/lipase
MKKIYLSILLLIYINMVQAQQIKTIQLYPSGKVPYQLENNVGDVSEYENQIITRKKTIQSPHIEIYYPAGEKNGEKSAVLICPGGGYGYLSHLKEGVKVAELLNNVGIIGIIMNSRLPDERLMTDKHKVPLTDVHMAMTYLRKNAAELGIKKDKIGVMGFSAGGHLASSAAVQYDTEDLRPDLSLLIYPVITMDTLFTHKGSRQNLLGKKPSEDLVQLYSSEKQITTKAPPTFIVHSTDDAAVPVKNSLVYIDALIKNGVKNCSFHIFPTGGHGYGLAQDKKDALKSWPDLMIAWLKDRGW